MASIAERRTLERPWLASYPPGVPAEIDPSRHASIREVFLASCERYADAPAFSNMGRTVSFREVDRLSRDFAAWLQGPAGLAPGARIALMMPNLLQYPVALFG